MNKYKNKSQNYINIDKCIFNKNSANVFGGAIYSTLKNNTLSNTKFLFNHALNAGGILYLYYDEFENIENSKYLYEFNVYKSNNTAGSFGNNYTSNPSQVLIENENINNISVKSGICNITELKLYSFPNRIFSLNFFMDLTKYNNIYFKNNNITVKIKECDKSEISITNYGIPHCEKPICDCTKYNETNVICSKGQNNINNYKENKCVCINGYNGETCNDMIIYDIRYLLK
ncbi:hypothetical protein BCR36DRAFT_280239 [Piromyces finnis]|uniref:EGF-like domain-containing protein n=1 Tax=Piromyces finnis TaxID=1754191 RepID=A0A1Y1VIS2_9FUNG|nr:hypothetical protein BCR36DRAFT_280239 [Piromyces finnis]|eukprot:ORX56675.1 hypothetical protein BCR36DRAFT_280239 [Piromyces finnis]